MAHSFSFAQRRRHARPGLFSVERLSEQAPKVLREVLGGYCFFNGASFYGGEVLHSCVEFIF